MKKFLLGIVIALIVVFGYQYIREQREQEESLREASELIQKEIKNVSKLVVSEGTYAQIYNYNNQESFLFDFLSARKKALIVVNAKATVAYDLREMKYDVDLEKKSLTILQIPDPELNINPNIEFYDVTQDYLNQFKASDFNNIKSKINKDLKKKIGESVLMSNAENRLISELQKLFILTNSMGWTLQYNGENVNHQEDLQKLKS